MEFDSVFVGGLVGVAPNLAFWIAVIVLASIVLRRGGDRAGRFIIAGASLKLVSNGLDTARRGQYGRHNLPGLRLLGKV